jgi:predicted porin
MRYGLLLSTALLTGAVFLAPSARAEMDVNVGGYVTTQAGFFDNDNANSSDRDFRSKSEIRIRANGTADNGLEYGARIDLLTSTDNTTNSRRTGIHLESGWGRFEFGDMDGATNSLTVLAPTVGIGQINGSYVNFIPVADRPAGSVVDTGGGILRPVDSDQSTKVTYYTPKFAGFQAGLSYVPELEDSDRGEQVQFFDNVGTQENGLEFGLNYRNSYDNGMRVNAGLGYVHSDAKTGSGREDVAAWSAGLRVGYKQFEFGGSYVDNGDSNNAAGIANDDESAFNLGARYQQGSWGVALNYIQEDYDTNGGRGLNTAGGKFDALVLGGTYKIAPGLTTGADLAFFDRNRDTGADTDGYVLVLETKASF